MLMSPAERLKRAAARMRATAKVAAVLVIGAGLVLAAVTTVETLPVGPEGWPIASVGLYGLAGIGLVVGALLLWIPAAPSDQDIERLLEVLTRDPSAVERVEYRRISTGTAIPGPIHRLRFRVEDEDTTFSLRPVDVEPILSHVRATAPSVPIVRRGV